MQGGINNAALFNASQREARGKLEQMAGIKRPPSGILASSPELMQAATAMPPRPQPMAPAPVPMVQPALPQVPMQTTVAPMQQAPAPRPMAPAPQPQQPPVMMNEGGFLTRAKDAINAIPGKMAEAGMFRNIDKPQPVDITQDPVAFLEQMNEQTNGAITETFGSVEKALVAGRGKKAAIDKAVETGDEEKIVNTVLANAEVPITDEGKQDFARNVFGLEDVNDIDEINRRIADVAISSAIGKGPDEFAQAVLLGLNNYKQTASARAAAKSGGGSGMSPLEPFPDAVRDLAGKIMTATGEDPAVAIQQARDALAPYYTGQAGPTTTETTETATVTMEQHKSANDAAKEAGQKTYTLGGQEFQVQ